MRRQLLWVLLLVVQGAFASSPLQILREHYPALFRLHQNYPGHHQVFENYAVQQGFAEPVERLATVIHELIHVDSAAHMGFFIDGVYYEPYVAASHWPRVNNQQLAQFTNLAGAGAVFHRYVLNTPTNHLGNVIDEINAYAHVLPFVCAHEPKNAQKQTDNLIGFLFLVENYLRVLRTVFPDEYRRLTTSREAKGAFGLVVSRAWRALQGCRVPPGNYSRTEAAQLIYGATRL